MRRATTKAKTFATLVFVSLLILSWIGAIVILPDRAFAQGSGTITGVGPWTQQGNYGSSSTTPGQGGIGTLGASCVVYSGDVYCVGGQNPSGTDISDVFYAQLSSSGSIGPWTETTDYVATSGTSGTGGVGIEWPSCVESGGYIYCVAGATNTGIISKVYYAQLSSSGVGPWTETIDYGAASGSSGSGGLPVFQLSCVTDSGYIYCVGGGAGSKVFYAQLSSSGVGPWTETTDYGAASGTSGTGGVSIDSNACVADGGDIYCVGGTGKNYAVLSDVFSAPLNSSGGVGAWTENTDYGATAGSTGSGGVPIYGTSCVVYFSYVICIGGDTTGNAGTNYVFFGQDGNIPGWKESEEGYIVDTYWDDCIAYGGYVYCWGQDDPNVYSSPIETTETSTSSSSSTETTTTTSTTTPPTTTTTPVLPAKPTLVTTVYMTSPTSVGVVKTNTITLGQGASDTALLEGGYNPTGTIHWVYYLNGNCGGNGQTEFSDTVTGNGAYTTPTSVYPAAPGNYSFYATYGGDPNNLIATSGCEPFTVVVPTTTTTSSTTSTSSTSTTSTSSSGSPLLLIGGIVAALIILAAILYYLRSRGILFGAGSPPQPSGAPLVNTLQPPPPPPPREFPPAPPGAEDLIMDWFTMSGWAHVTESDYRSRLLNDSISDCNPTLPAVETSFSPGPTNPTEQVM